MNRIVVAAGVIRRQGKILLTRRMKGTHLAGLWEFPGGKLEPGEGPIDALIRECREECGIEVKPLEILEVTFHSYPEKDVILLFYDCEIVSGEVRHLGVADHAWCSPAELGEYPLPPADVAVLQKLQAGR